jgi:cytochrome c biogenesis protein CcdA
VVINHNRTLLYPEITQEGLDNEIRLAEAGAYPVPEKRRSLFDSGPVPSLAVSFVLGLMTGFSPCLLGSLVVILAAGNGAGPGSRQRYVPLVFGAGILTSYLVLAAVILVAGFAVRPDPGLRLLFRGAGGIAAIGVGLVQAGLFSLPDRPGAWADALALRFRSVPGIFLLGLIFAVLFAPCAIAPFLVFTSGLLLNPSLVPALMLPAFSLGVLAPFAALTLYRSTVPGERLLKDAGIIRRAGGWILIAFGVWLILFA